MDARLIKGYEISPVDLKRMIFIEKCRVIISCFPVGYREMAVKIFFDLTLVAPVKISIFMFLLSGLIARASQPDRNMTSFTLFSHLT